jgi:type II secretion system protein N
MNVIKWILKALGALLTLLLLTLVAVYLTVDISRLTPSLERLVSHHTGAEAKLEGLTWASLNRLHLDRVTLTWPLSPEEEQAWSRYRTAKRAQREAGGKGADKGVDKGEDKGGADAEALERPLPALALCATSLDVGLALWPLLGGESLDLDLDGRLLSCLDDPTEPLEGATRRLTAQVSWRHDGGGVFGPVPKSGVEVKLKGALSELPSSELTPLLKRLPLEVKGSVNASFDLTLPLNKRGSLKPRQGDGSLLIEGQALSNGKGLVGAFEVPPLKLGTLRAQLRLTQGTLYFEEVTTNSSDLTGELTGSVGIRSSLQRLALKTHLSLDLSPELVKATPELKTIAMLQRRFFKPKGGGYHVGVEFQGSVKRLKSTPREFSPYSKSGRAQQREKRSSARVKPSTRRGRARPASRPKRKRATPARPQRKRARAPRAQRPKGERRFKGKRSTYSKRSKGASSAARDVEDEGEALGPLADPALDEVEEEVELEAGEEPEEGGAPEPAAEGGAQELEEAELE